MINKIIFKKIKFNNLKSKNFEKYIKKSGVFVFPAGPALASIEKSKVLSVDFKSRLCFF